jgi:hypothetical protein
MDPVFVDEPLTSSAFLGAPLCSQNLKITFTGANLKKGDFSMTNEETTFFIDWDDTCMCSHWLKVNGFSFAKADTHEKREFLEMGEALTHAVGPLLMKLAEFGRVVIVTNANDGWVQESCSTFMPKLVNLIGKLTVVSAQDRYRPYVASPIEWKRRTFRDVLDAETRPLGRVRNLISIGDGTAEHVAIHSLDTYPDKHVLNPKNILKSVKLLDMPSPNQLIEQLVILTKMIEGIMQHPNRLDIYAHITYSAMLPPLPPSEPDSEAEVEADVENKPEKELDEIQQYQKKMDTYFKEFYREVLRP